jgi:hypothetical protein
MKPYVSHDREQETPEQKARWFQSLALEERMEYLCFVTDLVLENNAKRRQVIDVESTTGRVQVLSGS